MVIVQVNCVLWMGLSNHFMLIVFIHDTQKSCSMIVRFLRAQFMQRYITNVIQDYENQSMFRCVTFTLFWQRFFLMYICIFITINLKYILHPRSIEIRGKWMIKFSKIILYFFFQPTAMNSQSRWRCVVVRAKKTILSCREDWTKQMVY